MRNLIVLALAALPMTSLAFADTTSAVDLSQAVTIYTQPVGDRTGMSFDQAMQTCKTYQRLNRDRYFYVYCDYFREDWNTDINVTGTYQDYRFMGYSTSSYSSSESESSSASAWAVYGRFRSGSESESSYESSSSSSTSDPVIETVEIPYSEVQTVSESVYGITVYGLGDLATLPEKTLVSSEALGEGLAPLVFGEEGPALLACWQDLQQRQAQRHGGWVFDRATCAVQATDSGFAYAIETQNPLVK